MIFCSGCFVLGWAPPAHGGEVRRAVILFMRLWGGVMLCVVFWGTFCCMRFVLGQAAPVRGYILFVRAVVSQAWTRAPHPTPPLSGLHADSALNPPPSPRMFFFSGVDEDTTLALYFEVTAQPSSGSTAPQAGGGQRYLQLLTSYQHSSGQYRLRVTTLARPWAEAAQIAEIARGFDQEAAAVLMARIASHKTQTEEVGGKKG